MGTADKHTDGLADASSASHVRTLRHEGQNWIDITAPDKDVFTKLEADYGLHPVHLRESVQKVVHTQVEREKDYLFLVLHMPRYDASTDQIYSQQLALFLGKKYLITIHTDDNPVIDQLFETGGEADQRLEYFKKGLKEIAAKKPLKEQDRAPLTAAEAAEIACGVSQVCRL